MCGFLSYYPLTNKQIFNENRFKTAAQLLHHRGRSEYKELLLPEIKLAFHRLSIRDLSNKGSQPIY